MRHCCSWHLSSPEIHRQRGRLEKVCILLAHILLEVNEEKNEIKKAQDQTMGISLLDMQRKQKNHGCSKIKKLKIKLYQNPERNLRKKVMVPKASGYLEQLRPQILAIRKPAVRVVSVKGKGRSHSLSHLEAVQIRERSESQGSE